MALAGRNLETIKGYVESRLDEQETGYPAELFAAIVMHAIQQDELNPRAVKGNLPENLNIEPNETQIATANFIIQSILADERKAQAEIPSE